MAVLDLYLTDFIAENAGTQSLVHSEALAWCENLRQIMLATGVLENKVRKSSLWSPFYLGGKFNVRHLFRKLDRLAIFSEDTGERIRFFDMAYDERCRFVDMMLADEAQTLTEKIAMVPQLGDWLAAENQLVVNMMAVNQICGGKTGRECDNPMMRLNGGFDIFANYPHCPISRVRDRWKGKVRRGDILLALPKYGNPWIFANLTPRVTHKMGHVGVITKDIEENTDIYSKCTVECMLKKGVHERTMKNWDTPHYILGVQEVRWHWKWNGGKSTLRKEAIPVQNVSALADIAEKYIGRSYARWYEIVTCKWAAPARFTCSTLVWFCAKKAYGFSISNWLFAFSTPCDIMRSSATYIKEEVK